MSWAWRTATPLIHCAFKQACIPAVLPHGTHIRLIANHQCRLSYSLSLSCVNDHQNVKESSEMRLTEEADSSGKDIDQKKSLTTYEVLKRLKSFGISGVLSYGLLNTAYYLSTFLFVCFRSDLIYVKTNIEMPKRLYVAPVPGKMGFVRATERFLKVLVMVWAGSQVTKLIRAGGALALAPVVERGLSWLTAKYKFQSQRKAFMAVAGFCFGLAFLVFFVVTALWA